MARPHRPPRSDAVRSRGLLIDAVERLLEAGRVDFSVPDLAGEAGVGVATAYRHYPAPSDALDAYYARAVSELVASLMEVDDGLSPAESFDAYCATWVAQAELWGPAVRHIRSHRGFIERLNAGDPSIVALYQTLHGTLNRLVDAGSKPPGDPKVEALLWITIFDERVIYDLGRHHHWSRRRITDHLTRAASSALQITS